jgi:hypothetical protein
VVCVCVWGGGARRNPDCLLTDLSVCVRVCVRAWARANTNWRPSMRHLKLACDAHAARKGAMAAPGAATGMRTQRWVAGVCVAAVALASMAAAHGHSLRIPAPWLAHLRAAAWSAVR